MQYPSKKSKVAFQYEAFFSIEQVLHGKQVENLKHIRIIPFCFQKCNCFIYSQQTQADNICRKDVEKR